MIPDELPPGNWRLDPFARVQRFVPVNPDDTMPDAFDEPFKPVDNGKPLPPIKHGTPGGLRQHSKRNERACRVCATAEMDRRKARALTKWAEGDPAFSCADCGAFTRRRSARCRPCAIAFRWSYKTARAA